jgi:hypothetical protein
VRDEKRAHTAAQNPSPDQKNYREHNRNRDRSQMKPADERIIQDLPIKQDYRNPHDQKREHRAYSLANVSVRSRRLSTFYVIHEIRSRSLTVV